MEKLNIIICDDDPTAHYLLEKFLSTQFASHEFFLSTCFSPETATAEERSYDLCFVDLCLQKEKGMESGLEVVRFLREKNPLSYIVVFSSLQTVNSLMQSMHSGADDYLPKEFSKLNFTQLMQRFLEQFKSRQEALKNKIQYSSQFHSMENMYQDSDFVNIAKSDLPLLIEGETGTGKEVLARRAHQIYSGQERKPFIALHCNGIPETLFEDQLFGHEKGAFTGADQARAGYVELSHGGTLFLDEVHTLPKNLQTKILRVLEDKKIRRLGSTVEKDIQFRLIAAANCNLLDEVEKGNFLPDLFFRITGFVTKLLPLRERKEELNILARKFAEPKQISCELIQALNSYSWPGNVRELKTAIEAAKVLANSARTLKVRHMPQYFWERSRLKKLGPGLITPKSISLNKALKQNKESAEVGFLENIYIELEGNISKMARQLNVNRPHLYNKLVRYGIHSSRK